MIKILVFVFALLSLSTLTYAADSSSGCGMGWYVTQKNSLLSSLVRTTTNGLFFNQTFGMTFGTSNCAKHDIVKKEKEAIYFAEANKEYLMIEMSEGKGEYVTSFAHIMGCQGQNAELFNSMTQKQYPAIFTSPDISADQLLNNISIQVIQDPVLAQNCQG